MSWFRIDDGFWGHEKVTALSDAALALWVQAGSWTTRYRRDGSVPRDICKRLGRKTRAVSELIHSGLWVETSEGYAFHDFAEYQPHIAKQEDTKEQAAERQRKSRMSRVTEKRVTCDPVTRASPILSIPILSVPSPPAEARAHESPLDLRESFSWTATQLVRREFARRFEAAEHGLWPRGSDPAVDSLGNWLASLGGDMAASLERLLDAFFADPWARSQHFPVQHLAKYPQKYFEPRSAPAPAAKVDRGERIAELNAQLHQVSGDISTARTDGSLDAVAELIERKDELIVELRKLKGASA